MANLRFEWALTRRFHASLPCLDIVKEELAYITNLNFLNF